MERQAVVIVAAACTAVGTFSGQFAATPAHVVGAVVIWAALTRCGLDPATVDEVILGQVLTAGLGRNPPRQAAIAVGLPQETTVWGIDGLCGSGLHAVALGMQQIARGEVRVVVAGGQENMSLAPQAAHLRSGRKMGEVAPADTMLTDGLLLDTFERVHMGITAESLARIWQVSRAEQAVFALRSQPRLANRSARRVRGC